MCSRHKGRGQLTIASGVRQRGKVLSGEVYDTVY